MSPGSAPDAVLEAARTFGRTVIEPQAEIWNEARGVPRSFFGEAARAGLCGLLVPRAQGGAGLDARGYAEVLALLARHCLASTFALVVHNNLAAMIAREPDGAHARRYLRAMLAGETIGAFLLTEPGAGSDAQAIATRCAADSGGWVLNGAKAWVSNAVHADLLCVYAQSDPGSGARGIACLLIERATPGVGAGVPYALLGGHALGTGAFTFDDCRVGAEALLHPAGTAFRAALAGIDLARVAVAAMCCGILERALAEALAYTAARPAFGHMLADLQTVQFTLADCATDLEAARALTSRAAGAVDGAVSATLAAAHAKKFATRVAFARIGECMQLMGAAGLSCAYPLARHLAAAKIAQYLDGATEIQNVVIGRALHAAYGSDLQATAAARPPRNPD